MGQADTLHDQDFFAWSQEQAEALRAAARDGSNRSLDWENLAEEIDSLGISQKTALRSQIRRIIEHLIKLEHATATYPRAGWCDSIADARTQIEVLLEDSPSLKSQMEAIIRAEMPRATREAIRSLVRHEGETEFTRQAKVKNYLDLLSYTSDHILGDWFPPEAGVPQG